VGLSVVVSLEGDVRWRNLSKCAGGWLVRGFAKTPFRCLNQRQIFVRELLPPFLSTIDYTVDISTPIDVIVNRELEHSVHILQFRRFSETTFGPHNNPQPLRHNENNHCPSTGMQTATMSIVVAQIATILYRGALDSSRSWSIVLETNVVPERVRR
jgi:hypothetical protein